MVHRSGLLLLAVVGAALIGCGDPEEAPRIQLPVFLDPRGLTRVTTDLGYEVELTEARLMVEGLSFSVAGEAHMASLVRLVSDLLVPPAYAHPGHYQEGDVTGELQGRLLLNWFGSNPSLGPATLVLGKYKSANFTLTTASAEDRVDPEDALFGHTAVLRGSAQRGEERVSFSAVFASPPKRQLVGVPFELEVRASSTERLGLRLLTRDPLEGDTLFDGIDFAALDADNDGQIAIRESPADEPTLAALNQLRRTLQTHDHFELKASPPNE